MRKLFTLFATLAAASLINVALADCSITVVPDQTSGYEPTQIANGSFDEVPWMSYYRSGHLYDSPNNGYMAWWATIDYSITNGTNQGWNTTENQLQSGNLFEYVGGGYVEMNAVNSAMLYQDLYTNGHDVIRWSLGHKARGDYGDSQQDMYVVVGAPLYDGDNIVYPTGVNNNIDTKINTATQVIYRSVGVTMGSSAYGSGENLENLSLSRSTQNSQFYYCSGIYVVPSNQSVTRFGFVAEDEGSEKSGGNYLDDITFSTLIGNLSASYGANNSVVIKGYWGEEDTSKKLVIKIGSQTLNVDMSGVVGQNFTLTIPAECTGGANTISVYHQDYVSAETILPVNQPITVNADNVNVVYDGVTSWGISPVVTVPASGYTITYGTSVNSCNLAASPTYMEPGTYTIYYMVSASGYTTEKKSATVFIDKKPFPSEVTINPPSPIDGLMQNGQNQTLVTAGSATGFTMAYALGADGNTAPTSGWSTSLPTGKHWGDYYVWYRAIGGEHYYDSNAGYVVAHISEPAIRTVISAVNEVSMGSVQMTSIYFSEDFETGDFDLPEGWSNDATYPWGISGKVLKSGNEGEPNTHPDLTVAVNLSSGGTISFRYRTSSQQYYDYGRFYIDGSRYVTSYYDNWSTYTNNNISAGVHTFTWDYYKNGSTDEGEDAFFIDDIVIRELLHPSITSVQIANGEKEYMKALPSDTYHFVNWTDESNNVLGTSTTLDFAVLRDMTVTANFAVNPVLTIQTNGTGNGTVAFNGGVLPAGVIDHGDGTYSVFPGTQISLKATPAEGSFFAGWENASDNSTRTFTVNSNMTVAATFTAYATLQVSSNDESIGIATLETNGAGEQQLTVYDGTDIHSQIPMAPYWFDNETKSQHIIPATMLVALQGMTINSITYYIEGDNSFTTYDNVIDVYLKEVDYTTFSYEFEDKNNCTPVYSGQLTSEAKGGYSEMTITFTSPYTYQDGNLLVGFENQNTGDYWDVYFYGEYLWGEEVAAYSFGWPDPTTQEFLPKTTFTYSASGLLENPSGGYYIVPGETITATATLTGGESYGFLNWTANGVPVSTELEINYTVTETVNLVANFAPKVTVAYDGNGNDAGDAPIDATIYLAGQSVTTLAAPNSMLKTGYDFEGWLNDIDGIAYAADENFTITASTTLSAQWAPTVYTISYDLDGGNTSNPTEYTIESADITLANPTKAHFVFLGWTGSNGSTPDMSVTIAHGSIGDKSYTANWEACPPATFTVPTAITGLNYTGSAQTLITAGSAEGGEMQYKLGDGEWSPDLPQATEAGDYTVYYRVVADDNHTGNPGSSVNVTIAAATVLYDDASPTAAIEGMATAQETFDITMNRTIYADGDYNTICLPFDVTESDFANPVHPLYGYERLKSFRSAQVTGSGQNLSIDIFVQDATEIIAGVPYLITYPSSHGDIVDAVFSNVLITATEPGNVSANGVTFQGMFAPVHITTYEQNTTQDFLFLGANNELYWPSNDGSSMRGFRAYFIIDRNTISPSQAPKGSHARIVEREDNTTEIESIMQSATSIQKVLRNGQLIIIRNGVEYNANGQMIK